MRHDFLVAAAAGLAAAALLASCTVGPDFTPPAKPDVPAFTAASSQQGTGVTFTTASPDLPWWQGLGDPLLAELVGRAFANNQTLAAAKAHVQEAKALYEVADAQADPLVNLLSVLWEPDIFGRGRRTIEAAEARYGAAVEQAHDALLVVAAEVARNYIDLRADQRRMAVAESTVALRETLTQQVRNKARMGLALDYDVAGAEAQLRVAKAEIPRLRARIAAAAHRIGVLTGDQPTALVDRLSTTQPIPGAPDVVPVGLPSTLLERRPDVRRAERDLHAATAEVGVATADLFPRFSLTGTVGLRAANFSELFRADAVTWRIGVGILMPLFNRERLNAQVRADTAKADAALAEYRQTVLQALEEVESNLVRYGQEQIRRRELQRAVDESRRALAQARDLYGRGLKDIVHVLTAQHALSENQEALIASDAAAMQYLVVLYKALGGGWSGVPLVS